MAHSAATAKRRAPSTATSPGSAPTHVATRAPVARVVRKSLLIIVRICSEARSREGETRRRVPAMRAKGPLIAIEGGDGAGTTTQTRRLAEWLVGAGRAVHATREPSTGPIGPPLRPAPGGRAP